MARFYGKVGFGQTQDQGNGVHVDVVMKLSRVPQIACVASEIREVLTNLVFNAVDAMPDGGTITIRTETWESGIRLTLTDSGMGMPPEVRERVFEPFFTTKGAGKGTGLGLSMVYGIVKQSNGYIWVTSEPGKGATFKLYFPRVSEEAEPIIPRRFDPPTVGGSETILVVEDDPALRELVVDLLKESGYKVLAALDTKQAIDLAKKKKNIHLLLTDVIMPTMSGGELAKQICKLRPVMKVLFMSGYSGDLVAKHGILEAETNLVEKPFTKHALLGKVRAVLDN